MSWKPEVDEIARRRELAAQHGGPEAVRRHRELGRATVRERIESLADKDSFRELGGIAGRSETDAEGHLVSFSPANAVVGLARIEGRLCVVSGDDFTQRGAAYSAVGMQKASYADRLACQRRIPVVRLLEAGGASVSGMSGGGRSGYDFVGSGPAHSVLVDTLASVPMVSAALGPVAGFPAARLVASHLSIMTRDAQVLIGGPVLVARATGEEVGKEELGGPQVHLHSGVVDNLAEDEEDAWRLIRRFLSYLPSHVWELPPRAEILDPPDRRDEALLSLVPRERRRPYKMRRLVAHVVDRDSFFELTPLYGRNQITGLARLAGQPVGVLANDPYLYGGSMTAEGARKLRRFAELCDTFHLPVLSFVDEPGFMIGSGAERAGTIRFGMEAMFAVMQSRVPWLSVVVRRAFGVAAGAHLGPGGTVVAWPSAASGALPLESGVALAFRREIAEAEDSEARRREIEEELAVGQSVFPRAEAFGFHDLIDPRDTRPLACDWLDGVQNQLAADLGPRAYSPRP